MRSHEWEERGSCAKTGPDDAVWFPQGKGARMAKIAKQVCDACPVRRECAEAATAGDESGVWAGTNKNQRHAAAVAQRRKAAAARKKASA